MDNAKWKARRDVRRLLPPMAMLSSTRQRRPWKTLSLVSCTSQHHPSRSPLLPLPLSYGFVRLKMAKCTFLIGIRSSRDPRIRPRALLQLTTPSRSGGGRGSGGVKCESRTKSFLSIPMGMRWNRLPLQRTPPPPSNVTDQTTLEHEQER